MKSEQLIALMAYINASIQFALVGGQDAYDRIGLSAAKAMSLCDDFNEGEDV